MFTTLARAGDHRRTCLMCSELPLFGSVLVKKQMIPPLFHARDAQDVYQEHRWMITRQVHFQPPALQC